MEQNLEYKSEPHPTLHDDSRIHV